ncbi:hypothetical protein ACFQLX_05880 [Streptomyces polyrhachis]|uniref:Secreted protein n=1 Tax=Streptomyces polyrhachis TaxID=1282885 RepID=A0ABW2GA71_9ACTN
MSHRSTSRTRLAVVCAGTALATFAAVGTATAADPVMNGSWGPFNRCPVDAAELLAANGVEQTPQCVVASSPGGTFKMGRITVTTGKVNVQFGAVQNADGTTTTVGPAGGAIKADAVTVPGGLLGIMCPSEVPVISAICEDLLENNTLNKITATVESAGSPRDFNQYAAIVAGEPIVTVPIKVKLKNPFLSDSCYIGSNSNPILLKTRNAAEPGFNGAVSLGNGTPVPEGEPGDLTTLSFGGTSLTDNTFAIPGASNCGLFGAIDLAVNLKSGIPAATGNSINLGNAKTAVTSLYDGSTVYPDGGQAFSGYWHSGVTG